MIRHALFDLDGTLADYDGQLIEDLRKIASPIEPEIYNVHNNYPYLEARRHVITNQRGWWLGLKKLPIGFEILDACKYIGYKINILTKGPSSKYHAWSEKLEWVHNHIGKDYIEGVTVTHDKSLVYGDILVDDYPDYVEAWLSNRPRGLVIMPAHNYNEKFVHPNVLRYTGGSFDAMKELTCRLVTQFNRVKENEQ